MSVSLSTESAIREQLQRAGRITAHQKLTFQPVAQNTERRDSATSRRHAIFSGKTAVAFLITGQNLAELRKRTELFSTAYPTLACPIFAHGNTAEEEFLLTEYFEGTNAGRALVDPQYGPDRVLAALRVVADLFSNAIQPSTPAAANEELQKLFARVLAIEYWTVIDRIFFTSIVFPLVIQRLISAPPRCRVSNGDLTLTNIMFNRRGEVRVVDYEGTSLTHFFAEDWLRLTYWNTPDAVRQFALGQMTDSAPVCLYLWLKQMVFEHAVIIPLRARVDIRHWGGEIRRFIEHQSPEVQQSLLWPAPPTQANRRLLRLYSDASHNFNRAIELCRFALREETHILEDNQTLLEQLNGSQLRLHKREIKILQMQRSFSWRATAWLRALRRWLIDPVFGKPAAPDVPPPAELALPPRASQFSTADFTPPSDAILHFQIESPSNWRVAPEKLKEITGWIFTDEPVTFTQVRARVGGRIYPGQYGLERPEILEKFLPRAHSGFRIELEVGAHDTDIELEIADSDGEWFIFFSQPLHFNQQETVSPAQPRLDSARNYYARWVKMHDTMTPERIEALSREMGALQKPPLISVLLPVYNTPERWLSRAIESARSQIYPTWELCIADDASTAPHIRPLLEKLAQEDPRIKVVFRSENGHISAATNSALELASGTFVVFLDHDDEIEPHALACFAKTFARHPDAEVVYSDEDKIDESGKRFSPHFKPDWNPDLLNSQNYLCHLVAYRTNTLRSVGGFRVGFEGSQDWDVALRITERVKPEQIHHVPRVLYHWRAISGSTARQDDAKDYTMSAARNVLAEHFQRLNQKVSLDLVRGGHWHVRYPRPEPPPLVTLIIPTRNRCDLLVTCIESLLAKTHYPNFEILVADNDSDDPELLSFYEKMKATGRVTVLSCPGPFNFSAINNRAVEHAQGTVIGLLNNDLETMHPEWLDEMVSHAVRPEIGVVGAKLYYPDMRIQHAGVITGLGGIAGHAFKKFSRNDPGTTQFRPHLVHNVSAVTAACAVLRKSVFAEAGGFNETELKIAFNDVDFCLRVQSLGYRNLFTPFAELIHHESASRGLEDTPEKIARFQGELQYMQKRWGERLLNDPAYNPNLTLDREDFSYAFPPRISN